MTYISRSIETKIKTLLKQFPCVAVLGGRQVGKSTLMKQLMPKSPFYDLENDFHLDQIKQNPALFLDDHESMIIIDEAQLYPPLFNALRVKIDENRKKNGQYLLSGSSSPELLKQISESLAGRIAVIELGPFQMEECWQNQISKFYTHLINQTPKAFLQLSPLYTRRQLYERCLYGGYPDVFLQRKKSQYAETWFYNYVNTYINRDIHRLFPTLNIETFKRFISMLAFSSGQLLNYALFSRSLSVSQPTVRSYVRIAEGTFIWRHVAAYESNIQKQLMKMPKGYLRDTGLITHFLKISSTEQLRSHPHFGNIWEAFICEQIIRSLEVKLARIDYYHYRTRGQAEINLILDGPFGVVPIEIKAGDTIRSNQLFAIKSFIEKQASPFGIIIYLGKKAYRIDEKLYVIPAQCL
ncbi:MAG: ATP-binding protein [Candidatus Margulisbacteria bacterium]|nr:ATP-binding protein [Candidatus Margulisiibacteriota bacterium]